MNINVHIERLVFDGMSVASGEAVFVQTAVEAELGRLLASGLFAPASSFAEARIAAGQIHIHSGTIARDLGVEIGRSVFRGLTQSRVGLQEQVKRSSTGRFAAPARGRGSSELLQTHQLEHGSRLEGDLRCDPRSVFRLNTTNNQRR